jgi:glycosyltransferase involved in cell wall biosynthesis
LRPSRHATQTFLSTRANFHFWNTRHGFRIATPNVIIEAITLGKPFVCSLDTGLNRAAKAVGLHVDSGDETAFRLALEYLLDPAVYSREVDTLKAFSYVRTWDDVTNDIVRELERIHTI